MNTRNQMIQWPVLQGFQTFDSPWTPFSELFDNRSSLSTKFTTDQSFAPTYDVEERDDHYLIELDIPGVKKEHIKIEFAENQLVICGERRCSDRKSPRPDSEELRVWKFQRRFKLPVGIDSEKVEAHYQDGVLRLVVPKAEAAKPRQIKITNGVSTSKFFSKFFGSIEKPNEDKDAESAPSDSQSSRIAS